MPFLVAWILALAMSAAMWAQTSATGVVTGRVSNAGTNVNLEGAVVMLEGTSFSTRTERDGTFALRAPPGDYTLAVSYTGLDPQTARVKVEPGTTVRRDFGLTSVIYKMGEFVVASEREGSALAITLQRQSLNVKNVISADAFGTLANGNPGELIMRVPGVVGDSVGSDIRFVIIRGMGPQLNTVQVDGNRMANAGSAGATRDFQFQTVVADSIERLEVTKSPTPDMDADSIGGAVNMVTKNAFDRAPGRRISYSGGIIWRPFENRDEKPGRRGYSFNYSEVFGEKKNVGVSFNYGMRETGSIQDTVTQTWQQVDTDPAFISAISPQDFRNIRTRWGGNVKLDYKLSEQTRFYGNVSMNKHFEHSNHTNFTYGTNTTVATVGAGGVLTGAGGIVPGYTSDRTEWRPIAASFARSIGSSQNKDAATWHYQIGAIHKFRSLNIDYDAYYSEATAVYPKQGGLQITAPGVGMRIERTSERVWPRITQISGPDMLNINSYTQNVFSITHNSGLDRLNGAQVNVKKSIETVVPTYIKVGARFREQKRDLTNTGESWTLVGPDGVMGVNPATGRNDDNLAQFLNTKYTYKVGWRAKDLPGGYPTLPVMTRAFRDKDGSTDDYFGYNPANHLAEFPNLWRQTVAADRQRALQGDRRFKETISAAYIMGNIDLGRLSILGGLRVEKTETSGEGASNEITPAEAARRAGWVGPVTDAEALRRVNAQYGSRITSRGEYQDLYPGLHFKLEPMKNLVARASWATNIGRPSIANLFPRLDVNHEALTLNLSNPALKPQAADNFDLGLEYYFEPVGVVSAGAFLKEIKDFIFTDRSKFVPVGPNNGYDGEYEGYNIINQGNGGSAKIQGIEIGYQQQFTFLPRWMKHFGIYANYTRLQTKGNYGSGPTLSTGQVAGFVPETANLGLSYIRGRLSLRVQFNHRGRSLSGYNVNRAAQSWLEGRSVVDIKTVFPVHRYFDIYLDVNNIFTESERFTTRGDRGRPIAHSETTPMFFFGFNGRL